MDIIFFASPAEFREWLEKNHATAQELWVGYHKKSTGKPSMTWPESVDQALCFGWIDGIRKTVDENSYTNRFTPRKPKSNWSAVNLKKVEELSSLGLMRPAGLKVYNEREQKDLSEYSYEEGNRKLPEAYEQQFQASATAWAFWQAQPPSYQKAACWWVVSAKREETRLKRLATLIEDSAKGKRIAVLVSPSRRDKD